MRLVEYPIRLRVSIDDPLAVHRWSVGFGCTLSMVFAVIAGMGQQFGERIQVIYDTEMPYDSIFGHVSLGWIAFVFMTCCMLNAATYLVRSREKAACCSIGIGVACVLLLGRWAAIYLGSIVWIVSPHYYGVVQ
ncbi:MAG: hypothetical protein GC159_24220 [Phycisphaera sp.]|nr:hypothetical protein [Phycisphaera sp.]